MVVSAIDGFTLWLPRASNAKRVDPESSAMSGEKNNICPGEPLFIPGLVPVYICHVDKKICDVGTCGNCGRSGF